MLLEDMKIIMLLCHRCTPFVRRNTYTFKVLELNPYHKNDLACLTYIIVTRIDLLMLLYVCDTYATRRGYTL